MSSKMDSLGSKTASRAAQRVVVIQDASRNIVSSAIRWALDGLSLNPGDELTLLGILHQVNNRSIFPSIGAGKLMEHRRKMDSTSTLETSHKDEELMRKEEEYETSIEIQQLTRLYNVRKVIFHKRVVTASLPKFVAAEAVNKSQATWIILDRQMKKDKKYFLERLSCGISRMKRNGNIELLRGPKAKEHGNVITNGIQDKEKLEMLPGPRIEADTQETTEGIPEDDDLFSLEVSPIRPKNFHEKSSVEMLVNRKEGAQISGEWQQKLSYDSLPIKRFEGNLGIIQNEGARGCMPHNISDGQVIAWSKTIENIELEQNDSVNEDVSETSSAIAQLQEPVEKHSVCSYCEKGKLSDGWNDFKYSELQAATKDFSTENFLSEGGFGSVYKGKLETGQWVAIKQHKNASMQGEKEFISEVHVLSKARHKNVVTLIGSCSEENQLLLVYEYICNGSLDKHLSDCSPKVLSWRERIKIALGAATGLKYLHQNNIIHRDVRPNNILITHNYQALIGDFGLAKTRHDLPDYSEKNILGAFGYLAPEYAENGSATTKTDVYSFGITLLELITGHGRGHVGWAMPLLRERRYPALIDEKIQDSYDVHQLFWMVSVAERCLSKEPDKRPSMKEVMNAMQCIMDNRTVTGLDFLSTCTSISSTRSPKSLIEQETSPRRSPSPTMGTNNTGLQDRAHCKKRRAKSRTRRQVSYEEMLS
ncbi:hypothetical protein Taro_048685 [Colocasia esculenta]|uniref:Protein kinase domain-containing protein n=1 Tax=Colocasia esculenta TaxID=4460 RepID=A0A843X8S5_COLES|nr:hypothetical protein [Colocasia esculenta]